MILWEDRVGKVGGGGEERGGEQGERRVLWRGGGGSFRYRFSIDLEGIMKHFKTIFGYFRM